MMQTGSVTTPFGRRTMTLGMLASQFKAQDIAPYQSVDKWKIFRALCEAKPLLGLSDRALAVLNALLSFYPGNELSAEHGRFPK
jgi:replication initiation protein RepC